MATSSLGRLTLDLAVRLSEFTDGMSRAERETADRTRNMQESVTSFREHLANELGGTQLGSIIDGFNERFGSLEGGITKVSGALAGMAVGGTLVALGALSKMAIESAKADAQMVILANRANTAVESFQVLSKAAEGLGFEQEALASVLADAQEKLGEFSATEGGGAADFFDALRNNTKMTDDQIKALGKTLQGKDGVEAIQLIKNKMDELGATSQEQRFVFESLASDLTNLMPLFANGGALLDKYGEALRDAGVIKTKEAIEQSQLLAAQTQSVQQRFDGFKSQLAGAMMPVLNTLAQHFLKGGDSAKGFGGIIQGVGIIAKGVAAIILTFSTVVGVMGNTIGATLAQLANVATTAINVWNADGLAAKAVAIAQGFGNAKNLTVDWFTTTIDKLKAADKTMGDLVNGQTLANDKLTQANLAMMKSQNAQTAGIRTNTKEAEDNAKAKEKLAKAEARLVGISGNTGIGTGAHLDIRNANGQKLTAAQLARFQAGGRALTSFPMTSGYGARRSPVAGASSFHRAFDFGMGVGTPITTTVPVKDVKTRWGGDKSGYISEITFADGLVVKLLHQSKSVMGLRRGSSNMGDAGKINDELIGLQAKGDAEAQREAEQAEKERQRHLEQDAKDRLSITQQYQTEAERIEAEHTKNLAEINRLYVAGSKQNLDLIARENATYQQKKNDLFLSVAEKYMTEEEKLELEHLKKIRDIRIKFANDPESRDIYIAKENEAYQKDLANFKWAQGEKARAQKALIDKIREDIGASTMQSTNDYLDATMKASMTPEQYSRWSLQRDYNNSYSSLYGQYQNRQNEINAKDDRGNFKIDDESERNALLEAARQEHLARLYVMESDHATKVKELDKQVNDAKAQQTSAAFGVMTSAMSAFFGQQSIAYKMAANAEKGYALYQAWLNSKKAVLAAYADTPGSIWAKMGAAGKAAIDTGLMTAAIQAISPRGFSDGGYTGNYGINDIAGVVHGQEYVLNATATKRIGVDNLNALNSGKALGNNVNVNVVVNSDGSGSVQSNAQMGKQMGDAIKAAVLQIIAQEKRQGGLLAR